MNYLVTGGAGFIGSHLVKKLSIKKNNNIYVIDLKKKINTIEKIKKVKYIAGDISNYKTFEKIKKKIDIAYHLAAQTSNQIGEERPRLNYLSNIKGSKNFFKWAINSKIKKCFFTSSMAVYGKNCKNISEGKLCKPISNYGKSKLEGENIIKKLENFNINYFILRFFNVYGPGQNLDNLKQGMISIYIAQALKGNIIKVAGSMSRTRDFIYINDVIDILLSNKLKINEIYNVGYGKEIKVSKAISLIKKNFKKKILTKTIKKTPSDIYNSYANINKIKKIKLKPKISLTKGISLMLKNLL